MAGLDAKYSVTSGLCLVTFSLALLLLPLSTFAQTPSVTNSSPGVNAQSVSDSTDIILFFNTTMDAATINDSTFVVRGQSTGPMAGTIEVSDLPSLASFEPHGRFAAGELVTVTLTNSVTSATGDSLLNGYSFSYTVGVSDSSRIIVFDSTYAVRQGFEDGNPGDIVTGDFNVDGHLDFAVNFGDYDRLGIFLNTGTGDMAEPAWYLVGDTPNGLTAADLDSDGDLDLVSANRYGGDVSILMNNGDGTFADQSTYYTTGEPVAIIATDLNGDGAVELVVAHGDVNVIAVIFNSGDGTFASHQFYNTTGGPYSLVGGDFDSDGDIDIATANLSDNSVSLLFNDGTAGLDSLVVYTVESWPNTIITGDLDSDGHLDLATTNTASSNVSVMLNDGTGGFSLPLAYGAGGVQPWCGIMADMNGDGALDIATANEFIATRSVGILINNGDGSFAPTLTIPTGLDNWQVAAGDLDGDRSLDLILSHRYYTTRGITILKQRAQPSVVSITPSRNELNVGASTNIEVTFDDHLLDWYTVTNSTFVVNGSYTGLHAGTIVLDSVHRTAIFDPDVDFDEGEVVSVALTGAITSAQGRNLKSHVSSFTVATGVTTGDFIVGGQFPVEHPRHIAAGDLDNDGDIDVAGTAYGSDSIHVFMNQSDGTFIRDGLMVGQAPYGICAADLDSDSDMDLATLLPRTGEVSVVLNNGDGSFGAELQYGIDRAGRTLTPADMDGDGDLDLVCVRPDRQSITILPNNGDGSFGLPAHTDVEGSPYAAFAGDLDADGDIDLAFPISLLDAVSIIMINGYGILTTDSEYPN